MSRAMAGMQEEHEEESARRLRASPSARARTRRRPHVAGNHYYIL